MPNKQLLKDCLYFLKALDGWSDSACGCCSTEELGEKHPTYIDLIERIEACLASTS